MAHHGLRRGRLTLRLPLPPEAVQPIDAPLIKSGRQRGTEVARSAKTKAAASAASKRATTAPPPVTNRERPAEPKRYKATKDELLQFYREMLLIRRFEERAGQLYGLGLIGGFCHLYIGQEAVGVGLQSAMTVGKDSVITGYRDHGHMLAYGIDPKVIMAELTGRAAGISKGKGGSMHMFSVEHGFYGGHGIVGAQVAWAPGWRSSTNIRAMAAFAWPISAMARSTRARSTRASTWPSCGSFRSSTRSRTTNMRWARASSARPPSLCSIAAARASGSPASRSTEWTCSRCAARRKSRSNGPAAARGRSSSS